MVNNFLDTKDFLREFEETSAILKGHFILSSGLHSDGYVQCSRVLMYPDKSEKLFKGLANKIIQEFGENAFDIVLGPAMGGVIPSYELARQLKIPAIFCERVDGKFQLRRGFQINENTRILIAEDVVTTGKSSLEALECVKENGGNVKAISCLVNRNSESQIELANLPLISLVDLNIKTFTPENVPLSLAEIPAQKPGSRFINIKNMNPV